MPFVPKCLRQHFGTKWHAIQAIRIFACAYCGARKGRAAGEPPPFSLLRAPPIRARKIRNYGPRFLEGGGAIVSAPGAWEGGKGLGTRLDCALTAAGMLALVLECN